MNYLVSNIKINNNERFEMQLPVDFAESSYVAKIYIRTYAFDSCKVTYDFESYKSFEFTEAGCRIFRYSTELLAPQPYDVNITDSMYAEYITISCIPQPKTSLIVEVSDEDIRLCDGDIEQAIYEKLLQELEIDFAYEYTT